MRKSMVILTQNDKGVIRCIGPFDRIKAQLWVDKYLPKHILYNIVEIEDPRTVEFKE